MPLNGDPTKRLHPNWRKMSSGSSGRPSSSKDVLVRLKRHHALPGVVLEWRKINMTVSKSVFPLHRARVRHPELGGDRVYTRCSALSATGRISLHEPNVQNIPR